MIFNIKFNTAAGKQVYKDSSAQICFFIDSKNLKNELNKYCSENKLELNKIESANFLLKDAEQLTVINANGKPDKNIFVKIKLDDDFSADYFRNYFAGLISKYEKENLNRLYVQIPAFEKFKTCFTGEAYYIQTIIEGILLGNYRFDIYKSEKKKPLPLEIYFNYVNANIVKEIIKETMPLLESVFFARDLVNEPASTLTPTEMVKRTKNDLVKRGVKVTVLNKKEIAAKGMNAILAVASGSSQPPYLMILKYTPKGKAKKKIALVGKGVTYDSGGLSIKPTSGMIDMNADMAGGAAVIGAIRAAAVNQLPVEVYGFIPVVENMIAGGSYKPGDVIKSASGKSIEVKDTDAEGRLILADALDAASKIKPDVIIDLATLTGAVVVALSEYATGLFTSDDKLAGDLFNSGEKTFERLWRLPFWNVFKKHLKSDIADVNNLGVRWGHASIAGKFLENFVDKNIPWAHLDIAGPGLKNDLNNYTEKYHPGYGVRLLYDYLKSIS